MEVSREIDEVCNNLEKLPKSYKVLSDHADPDFQVPLYNIRIGRNAKDGHSKRRTRSGARRLSNSRGLKTEHGYQVRYHVIPHLI